MIKIISFDLDGTLTTKEFADLVWLDGLPLAYAKEKRINPKTAKQYFIQEYDRIGNDQIEWYDLSYWINRFHLSITPETLLNQYQDEIRLYPEVNSVIHHLSDHYTLIISSNAKKEFIEIQLQKTNLKHFFSHVFSATSDAHLVKKDPSFYKMICDVLRVRPAEIIHIGDDKESDFLIPRNIGITSFYLDRKNQTTGSFVVSSLTELEKRLSSF